jgi:hypothetical protein
MDKNHKLGYILILPEYCYDNEPVSRTEVSLTGFVPAVERLCADYSVVGLRTLFGIQNYTMRAVLRGCFLFIS